MPLEPVMSSASDLERGYPTPPRIHTVCILLLKKGAKRGQNEGIFPAFEDTFRLTKRKPRQSQLRISMSFANRSIMSPCDDNYSL